MDGLGWLLKEWLPILNNKFLKHRLSFFKFDYDLNISDLNTSEYHINIIVLNLIWKYPIIVVLSYFFPRIY